MFTNDTDWTQPLPLTALRYDANGRRLEAVAMDRCATRWVAMVNGCGINDFATLDEAKACADAESRHLDGLRRAV